jgi:Fanconi anemia group M protein
MVRGEISDLMTPENLTEKEERSRRTADIAGQKSLAEYGRGVRPAGPSLAISRRLGGGRLREGLEAEGFAISVEDLECADVVVSDRVGVKIRSVPEFISDLSGEGLSAMLDKMKHRFPHPILIVQGPSAGGGTGVCNAVVYDALGVLLSESKMPALSTSSTAETVAAVKTLSRQEGGRTTGQKALQTTLDGGDRRLVLVQGLPNVSSTIAQRLLERFGSARGVADASPEQLMEVEGVVRVIAEWIHTEMRRRLETEEGPDAR